MYDLHDKILGSLVTAGMGDAIGAPSEAMSEAEIQARFGGPIETFIECKDNPYSSDNLAGEVTDDASQMYEMAKAVIATDGNLTVKAAADALLSWAHNYPRYYPKNAGPTMRYWVKEYEMGGDPVELGKIGKIYGRGISNGCAMRVAASGLCNPGNWDDAVKTAVTMTKVSHGTQHAYAGAAAVSCAIAEALKENAQISNILKAAVYGAKKGEEIGLREARIATGPSVLPRIITAIECVYRADNEKQALRLLAENVGCNGDIQPSTGIAIGLFLAFDGDPVKTIQGGANIGGDTDTFACIAGMISGAYSGFSRLPAQWYDTFKKANPKIDFEWAADELTKIAIRKMAKGK